MACRSRRVATHRLLQTLALVAAMGSLSSTAIGCSGAKEIRSSRDAPSDPSQFVGKEVLVSFKWPEPTSVLESLLLAGVLVRVEKDVLVIHIGNSVRSEQQERRVDALEVHGKLKRDRGNYSVHVYRSQIADLRLRLR